MAAARSIPEPRQSILSEAAAPLLHPGPMPVEMGGDGHIAPVVGSQEDGLGAVSDPAFCLGGSAETFELDTFLGPEKDGDRWRGAKSMR
jgi:hypothetical protein